MTPKGVFLKAITQKLRYAPCDKACILKLRVSNMSLIEHVLPSLSGTECALCTILLTQHGAMKLSHNGLGVVPTANTVHGSPFLITAAICTLPVSEFWVVVVLKAYNFVLQTEQVEAKDILDLVMAENTYAGTNHGLASARDPKDKDTVLRLDAIKEGIVKPWLEKPTGTLIIVTGLCDAELQDLLENLDNFNGFVERDVSASSQQPDPGSDYCKLAAYLRSNTVLGHPLHIKTLEEADFLPKDISTSFDFLRLMKLLKICQLTSAGVAGMSTLVVRTTQHSVWQT